MNRQFPALLPSLFLGAALAVTPALGWSQQTTTDQSAKQDMKDAGHETKDAAKDAGHGVKKGTKKAYNKTKNGTKKGWDKTKNTTKGAVNGAKEGAHEPTPPPANPQ
jgi:hypothetical protein